MSTTKNSIVILFILATSFSVYSKPNDIIEKCNISQSQDIKIVSPSDEFHLNDSQEIFNLDINPNFKSSDAIANSRIGSIYGMAFNSNKEDCMLLLPYNLGIPLRDMPKGELQAVFASENLNTDSLINVISLSDMSMYCNADTALIYEMVLPVKYLDKYTHCIGVYLKKYAHPDLLMKVMLTPTGLPNAEEYLRTILGCVEYGNLISEEGVKAEKMEAEWRRQFENSGDDSRSRRMRERQRMQEEAVKKSEKLSKKLDKQVKNATRR